MRKRLGFVLLLGLIIFSTRAHAQGETKLESVNIGLWSEFDQPSMLVIHEFVVAKDTTLPAKVTVRFPREGNLMAVAVNNNGNLVNTNFEGPTEQGNWQTIIVPVQSYDPYRVEYYQPLARDGNKRQFKYEWRGDYSVNIFSVQTLLPADSTNVITSPTLSNTGTSTDGLNLVGEVSRNGLNLGQSYEFTMEYTRASDAVTNSKQAAGVQPSEPIGPNTQGRVSMDKLPWIIGGVGLALIAIALFTYWRSTQGKNNSPARARAHRRSQQEEEDTNVDVYCHECGTRAHSGDRFCRTCGSRLRIE